MKVTAIVAVVLTSISILLSILALVGGLDNRLGSAAAITFDLSNKNEDITLLLTSFHAKQNSTQGRTRGFLIPRVLPGFVSLYYLNVCVGNWFRTSDASGKSYRYPSDNVNCSSRTMGYSYSMNDFVTTVARDRTLEGYGDAQLWDQKQVQEFLDHRLDQLTDLGYDYSADALKPAGGTLVAGLTLSIILLGGELAGLFGKGPKLVFMVTLAFLTAVMLLTSAGLLTKMVQNFERANSPMFNDSFLSNSGLSQRNPPLLGLQWAAAVSALLALFVLLGPEATSRAKKNIEEAKAKSTGGPEGSE